MGEDEAKVHRVLSELDALAENWAGENNMTAIAVKLANGDPSKRTASILAMLELAYAEGFYAAAMAKPDMMDPRP